MSFSSGFAVGAQVMQNRERLRMEKENRDQELQKQGYSFEDGKMQVRDGSAAQAEQMQALEATQLAKSLQAQLLANTTDTAFEDYAHTGDASYLQKALSKNPMLQKAWGERGVQLVDNVNFDQDHKLLQSAGIKADEYDTPEKRDLVKKNFYKTYDGTDWQLNSAHNAAADAGVITRLGERRSAPITNNYEQMRNMILEHRRSIANAQKGTTNANVDQGVINETQGVANQGRAIDENARQFNETLPLKKEELRITEEGNKVRLAAALASAGAKSSTANQKDLNAAEQEVADLEQKFGGTEQFFNTDFSDPKKFREAYKNIVKIEKLTGRELSEGQRKEITDIRGLINLADPASSIGEKETGVIDSQLRGVKKYLSDNVGGVRAETAYSAIRNVVRHDLYGSVLTPNEEGSFNKVMQDLGAKQGPVLEQLRAQVDQTRTKLQSAAQFMDPWAAKVYLGKNLDEVDAIVKRLDTRIAKLQGTKTPDQKNDMFGNIFKTNKAR